MKKSNHGCTPFIVQAPMATIQVGTAILAATLEVGPVQYSTTECCESAQVVWEAMSRQRSESIWAVSLIRDNVLLQQLNEVRESNLDRINRESYRLAAEFVRRVSELGAGCDCRIDATGRVILEWYRASALQVLVLFSDERLHCVQRCYEKRLAKSYASNEFEAVVTLIDEVVNA